MSTATILEIKPHIVWPAVTFLLGYLLGHWLALGRDKRKEWNDSLPNAREMFKRVRFCDDPVIRNGRSVSFVRFEKPDNVVIEDLCTLMSCLKRWRFKRAYRNLLNIMDKEPQSAERDQYYRFELKDYELVNQATHKILRFLKRQ